MLPYLIKMGIISLRDKNAVRYVKFGYLRIGENGNEIGRGEIGTI